MEKELLSEELLRKLEKLRLSAGKTRIGPLKGEHLSWRSGTSLEFLDYRKYQPGDDIRYVDWNVFGRLDKLFVKLFRSEEDLFVHFLIDCSRSMAWGDPPKMLYARKIAAALGYLALADRDRVRVVSFSDALRTSSPLFQGRKAYGPLLRFLKDLDNQGETRVNASLVTFAEKSTHPGWAVILSDLLDKEGVEKGLEALMQKKFRIVLIQILDSEERFPAWKGLFTLREWETGERKKMTITSELLSLYRKKMDEFLIGIRERCLTYGVEYHFVETSVPFEDFLFGKFLEGRLFR